ncbi:MAG: cob(I)yrinic acid a,c-diamide adenosyltransferase [Planctomycetia bacterium]|nr:cob(I)yrinic acid a,c-diamide adenosyltransferase [Planctomycetia bacterium]
MVYLSRIYTKTGDDGTTALGDATRVSKDDIRVAAYGTIDELNSMLGLLLAYHQGIREWSFIQLVQNDLFDVGADLCLPASEQEKAGQKLRVTAQQVTRLEQGIDRLNATLKPLTSFVLPGGSTSAAWAHLARTVCRRAEREVVTLSQRDNINQQVIIYLNRLSDYLFVLARSLNQNGEGDVLWKPGQGHG